MMITEKELLKRISNQIRSRREQLALTQIKAAELCKIDYKFYNSIECNKKHNITVKTLVKISIGLGINFRI